MYESYEDRFQALRSETLLIAESLFRITNYGEDLELNIVDYTDPFCNRLRNSALLLSSRDLKDLRDDLSTLLLTYRSRSKTWLSRGVISPASADLSSEEGL